MRFVFLLSLALSCVALASALPPLKCHKWQCSPFMRREVRPGTSLVYRYSASASASLPGKKTPVVLEIQTTATFDFFRCRRTLQLSKSRITSRDGSLTGDRKAFQVLTAQLEENVLYFRSNDGVIDGLCSKDKTWVANFKRGLLSVFQQPRSPTRSSFVDIQMMDIHGSCPARVTPSGRTVRLERKLDACRDRHRTFGGLQSEPYSVPSKVQNPGLGSSQRCLFSYASTRRVILQKALCEEKLVFKAPLIDSFLPQGSARVKQELELLRKTTFKCSAGCKNNDVLDSFTSSGLGMQFEERERTAETSKAMTDVLCRLAGPVRPENPALFMRLAVFLRVAKDSEWSRLVSAKPGTLCPKRTSAQVTAVLLEALAEAGDARAVRHLTGKLGPLSDSDVDRLLSSLAFTRRPGLLLPHLKPIFNRFHRFPRASLAAAALVHRFCAERRGGCDSHRVVRTLLAPLERSLKGGCHRLPLSRGVLLFRVMGNMRIPQRMHRSITDCAERRKAPVELQVAALEALRRSGCPSPRKALLRILESSKFDAEVRVAAYHALLVCRDARLASELRRRLPRIRAGHVASYIASHMSNLRLNTDPDQTALRHFLHDVGTAPRPQGGLSRHFQQSLFSLGKNLGVRTNGALVWSENSASPRSASAKITGQLFGRAVPLMEVRGRMENVHELMARRHVPYQQLKFMKVPKASAQLGLRYFGHDLLSKRMELSASDLRTRAIARAVRKALFSDFRRNNIFADFSTAFASGAGLPLRLAFQGSTSAALQTTKDSAPGKTDLGIKPELAVRTQMSAAFELPGFRFGGAASAAAHTRSEWRLKIKEVKRTLELSIKAPEKQEALNLRWSVESLHMKQATPVSPLAAKPAIQWRSKERLGYRLAVNVQNQPGSAAGRLNQKISVLAERQDSHQRYVMRLWDNRAGMGKREIGILMDMEGSRRDRAIKGVFKLKPKELQISMRGAGKSFDGAIGCEQLRKGSERCFLTGRNEEGSLVQMEWRVTFSSGTTVHKLSGKVGQQSLGRLDVRVVRQDRQMSFTARLQEVLREPVVLQGAVKRVPPNKVSVGELQDVALNMTSSFLRFDLTSKMARSARKMNAFLQVGYKVPKSARASASVKLGWVRLTDKAFRDKFTFKSFSSQLPALNTDLTLKSNVRSAADFRAHLVLKSWPRKTTSTASLRFLLDRKNRNARSLVFQTSYDVPKVTSGEAAVVCEWNQKHISFLTKVKHSCRKGKTLNFSMSFKRKPTNEIDAAITFSGMSPISLNSQLRRPANGGLSFTFALKPGLRVGLTANPFYRTILLEAFNAGWMAKGSVRMSLPKALNYTFLENSRYQIHFKGSHYFEKSASKMTHLMTSRSKQIYNLAVSHSRTAKKCSGSFDFKIGAEEKRNRLKGSYVHDAAKNLHNSNIELLVGVASATLRNDYSFELSPRQQKLDGRTHVTSTFGSRKRKLMLQTNLNNLVDQLNSDLQFSSFLDDKPSFVNVKINVKDKNIRSLAWNIALDSSFPQARSAELHYSHELGNTDLDVKITARYLKKSLQLSFGGKVKGRKDLTGSLSLDLGAQKMNAHVILSARRYTARLAHLLKGVELRGTDLKISPAQPSFDLEVREEGVKPHRAFFGREGSMWRASLEANRAFFGRVRGKASLHAGRGFLGHRFYLSSKVENGVGVPLVTCDVKLKRNGELQVLLDFGALLPANSPGQVNIDYQKEVLIASANVGPVKLKLQTIPMDERFLFSLNNAPFVVQVKREGDKAKIQTDIYGYGLRYRCRRKLNWRKSMTITRAGVPVFQSELTQVNSDPHRPAKGYWAQWVAVNFFCVPPPVSLLLLMKFKANSSTELGEFKGEADWDGKAATGGVKMQFDDTKFSADFQRRTSPSVKVSLTTRKLDGELEASAAGQSFRLRPLSSRAVPTVDVTSSLKPGRWDLKFNVTVDKPTINECSENGRSRSCYYSPGIDLAMSGRVWVTERRYGGFKYAYKIVQNNGKMVQNFYEEYRYEKNLIQKEIRKSDVMYDTTLDYSQKSRSVFSDAGQLTAMSYKMTIGRVRGNQKRVELQGADLVFNTSGGSLELRGQILQKFLANEPGTNRVVSLKLQFSPSPSLRLVTGLNRRVLGSVVRFNLIGAGRLSDGSLTLRTTVGKRAYMLCALRVALTGKKQFLEFKHQRSPSKAPKINLTVKLDRNPASAEQSIVLLRGGAKVLSTRYSRANRDVSMELTMFDKKHFQGGWKQIESGFEVLAQSVTMKKPLSLRFVKASAKACSVELRTGMDPTPLVLDLLKPKNGLYGFNVRRGTSKVLIEGQIRPFGPNKMSSLSIGRASLRAEASMAKRSAAFQLKGANPFDLTYERTNGLIVLKASSGQRSLLSMSIRSGPTFSLVAEKSARVTFKDGRLEVLWKGDLLARVTFSRPAPQSISTAMFWRTQAVRTAVDDIAEAWDRQLPKMCAVVEREATKVMAEMSAQLPASPPFQDVRSSFVEFGKVMRMARTFKSVDFVIQVAARRTIRYIRASMRGMLQILCNLKAKATIQRLRPGIYDIGDRFTTLQNAPDRLAQRFGRIVNGFVQYTLRKMILDLEEMKISRPDISRIMPSPDTLRYVQKQVNAGLTQLKAVTLLRGMQHLDKKLLRSMQEAVRRMQAAAKDNRLQSDLEKAMQGVERRLRSVDPDSWRLQLIRLLRCVLARVAKSEIAADMVRSSGHQLNEAARGVLQMAVPRIEQMNWRHGRARLLVHVPRLPYRPRLPAPPPPAIDFRRVRPGFFRPKVAALFNFFVHTFDQRNYFLDRSCGRLKLATYRDRNFGWEVIGRRSGRTFTLEVRLGKKTYVSKNIGFVDTGSDANVRVKIWNNKKGMTFLRALNRGFELETNPARAYVRMRLLSPHYFRKVEGLWGNNDELPNNDWAVPGVQFNSSKKRFLDIMTSQC